MTLVQFYDRLNQHDWFFDFSDDSRVYRNGRDERNDLISIARRNGPEYQKLYQDYYDYIYSGPVFGKPNKDKPVRPEEETVQNG